MPRPVYVTTSIPYVNGSPHLGHALEFVLADAIARHHRRCGGPVRLQSGTDDNSLTNVLAAEREGIPVERLVARNAARFRELLAGLHVRLDGFVGTSTDPVHALGARAVWDACAARGDLYLRPYRGLYCVRCEQFYVSDEARDERCPEHGTALETVEEVNWFFRLSRYGPALLNLIDSGRLRIVPDRRRNEARAFVAAGLRDFSVSRSRRRARGWGVPVPGDDGQVMYVWFDALVNYLTGLGFPARTAAYRTFWSDATRVHVVGKGILRFHAVYWPAILLSAGLPVPDAVLVHGYVEAAGAKLAKSGGAHVDALEVASRLGVDALRYWLLRAVGRGEDVEWSEAAAAALRTSELANELGNLVLRTRGMIDRYRGGAAPTAPGPHPLDDDVARLPAALDAAIAERLDPQGALLSIRDVVRGANRSIARAAPWRLAREGRAGELDRELAGLDRCVAAVGDALAPYLPGTASRIASGAACGSLFPRLS